MHPQHPHSHVSPVPLQPSTPSVPDAGSPPKVPYFNGAAVVPPPRQKGRPRKRKPKDLEAMTANIGEWQRVWGWKCWGGVLFDATWCTERGCLMRRRRRKDVIGYDCLIREKEKSLCRYVWKKCLYLGECKRNVGTIIFSKYILSCWSRRCHDFWASFWLRGDSFAFSAARARFIKNSSRAELIFWHSCTFQWFESWPLEGETLFDRTYANRNGNTLHVLFYARMYHAIIVARN